jgi:ElaB/YqjD/DUF883 family membrane-anchored ribosome-binding protein
MSAAHTRSAATNSHAPSPADETDLPRSIADVERALAALTKAAKETLDLRLRDACRRVEDRRGEGTARLAELQAEFGRYVAEKPVRTLLAAALAGCLLGAVWNRSRG